MAQLKVRHYSHYVFRFAHQAFDSIRFWVERLCGPNVLQETLKFEHKPETDPSSIHELDLNLGLLEAEQ